MDENRKKYLEKLFKDRSDSADILAKPSMRGIQRTVVEKYSDQAHFIYELLQNADDVEATKATFDLYKDKLVFKHNGKRHFSVSDPSKEDQDLKIGKLGDINSITSIANSNKTEAKIGKFGVGFKAVFQYTESPIIYDPEFCFRIERFIVPVIIDEDYLGRKNDETVFVFPFNKREKSANDAYRNISQKLCSLIYPLLFLKRLNEVELMIDNSPIGKYSKRIEQKHQFGNIKSELICLSNNFRGKCEEKKLWLFTTLTFSYNISVGFFVNSKGQLIPSHDYAFCFFPTKEITNLNFIIQAPFLLTDSREGIKSTEQHNQTMINELSKLAAKSILLFKEIGEKINVKLITDDILYIIPTNDIIFTDVYNKDKISFKPFFTAIKNIFLTEEIIPALDGYVRKENAFYSSSKKLIQLFTDKQLTVLAHNSKARWSFPSLKQLDNPSTAYIQSITTAFLNEESFLNGGRFSISAEFIKSQSFEWLHKLYKWMNETEKRTNRARTLPIFIDQNGNAVSAYDELNHLKLFLPFEGNTAFSTVNEKLLENKETKEFIIKLGIKNPLLQDEINSVIIPKYKNGGNIDTFPDFKKFFEHFKNCPRHEVDSFIKLIKDIPFLVAFSKGDDKIYIGAAPTLYFPSQFLFEYFETKPKTRFVLIDKYKEIIQKKDERLLIEFLNKLGVSEKVRILDFNVEYSEIGKYKINRPNYTRYIRYVEHRPDGFDELFASIQKTPKNSIILWNLLLNISSEKMLQRFEAGCCFYFYYRDRSENFRSTVKTRLTKEKWLINSKEQLVSVDEIYLDELSSHYDVDDNEFHSLVKFLGIKERKLDEFLSEKQLNDLDFVETLKSKGLIGKVKSMIDDQELSELQTRSIDFESFDSMKKSFLSKSKSEFSDEIDDEDDGDGDFSRSTLGNKRKMSLEFLKAKSEMQKIMQMNELSSVVEKSQKYSFLWFKTLLQMEMIESGSTNATSESSKGISIIFEKVLFEKVESRLITLKEPNRSTPLYLEDLSCVPLTLNFSCKYKTIFVEVINVQSYSVTVKFGKQSEFDGIDLDLIKDARLEVSNQVFLIEKLFRSFLELGFDDDFNMRDNLCENIHFIFGPPGTGKTTHLAQKVIVPLMRAKEDYKVLVLTPTNKAADVVVKRLFESEPSCIEWLVRFGTSSEESPELLAVFREKSFDIRKLPRNVVVTTIARFPYDCFNPDGLGLFLKEIEWDFIVIDEASMIQLPSAVLPLYKTRPKKFVISGDPFQIQPITKIDFLKQENVYKMVELDSFTDPQTKPHNFRVELLTTEFRSIPSVGEIYSKFAYGGVLQHDRLEHSKKPLFEDSKLAFTSINLIKFPATKCENIYKARKLQNKSSYHVYSALFVFEFIRFLSSKLTSDFTIGIISPYRGQVELIDKLVAVLKLPEKVTVSVGTVHGFQGDECDIVLVVLNPPQYISDSPDVLLNSRSVMNVAISRTRDRLFVLMPDDDTEKVEKLKLVKKVELLCKQSPECKVFHAREIEEAMCGDANYLEKNSSLFTHRMVNVLRKPQKKFDIWCDDSFIDVVVNE